MNSTIKNILSKLFTPLFENLQSRISYHGIFNPIKTTPLAHQLIPISPHIQDMDVWIVLKFFAKLGDKYIHAAGGEKITLFEICNLESHISYNWIYNPIKTTLSTHQLISISPHIQNLNSRIVLKFFAKLGDKYIHAAGGEKIV